MYTLTRNTLPKHVTRARANSMDVYHIERHLHLDVERQLNHLLTTHSPHALAVFADYAYSLAHFGVTIAVLVWLYVAHPTKYRGARTVLLLTTLVGLLGFWLYPLAPPRFFPQLGFVDTVVRDRTWGSWGSTAVTHISNQYAAMPSIHIAWSLWSATVLVLWARNRWLRAAAVLYPVGVLLVILATANHWTLDALGGAIAAAIGVSLWVTAHRVRREHHRRGPSALAASTAHQQPRLGA